MTMDLRVFAEECVRQGLYFGIEPHYLLAVANLRSGISDYNDGDQIGPFRLTQAEWDASINNDQFEIYFLPNEISDPRRQCVIFGLMARLALDTFASSNGRNPIARPG